MSPTRWWRTPTVLVTVLAVVGTSSCRDGRPRDDAVDVSDLDATFVPVEPPLTTLSPAAGTRAVTRSSVIPASFHARLVALDPTLTQFVGAAEAYDAVIISALATETARSDSPARIAAKMSSVSGGSEFCVSFHDCRVAIDLGGETDYDGISGGAKMLPNGEPSDVKMDVVELQSDGSRLIQDTVNVRLDDPGARAPFVDPKVGFRGDGILTFGTLLPVNGPEGELARAALAGVALAVSDINADNGVLGDPVRLIPDTSGDGSAAAIETAVTGLIAEGADVVIGGTNSAIDRIAVDAVTSAGLLLFSPTDGDRALSTIADGGRFFRLAGDEAAEGPALARLIASEGRSRVALVVGDDERSIDLNDDLVSSLSAAGVEVAAAIPLAANSEAPYVATGVFNSSADALVILARPEEAAPVITELIRIGFGPSAIPTYGSSALVSPDLVRLLES